MPRARKPLLRITTDHASMKRLATESGLEEGTLTNIVVSYGFYDGEELVGCAALRREGDMYSLECLAVKEGLRRLGLGTKLVSAIEQEARSRGASRLWALARAPDFFAEIGYTERRDDEAGGPDITSCSRCPQYRVSCNPRIVWKDL